MILLMKMEVIVLIEKIDYKKKFKDLYLPKTKPMKVEVPKIQFIMIDGKGNPNQEDSEYSKAVGILYALSYTIKMSSRNINGYFDYVVPPLEGLWWMDDIAGVDYSRKDEFCWTSMIRQPEFVTEDVFKWACEEVKKKKGLDTSIARLETYDEGRCVQCMHIGEFDNEPETVRKIDDFIKENDLQNDIGAKKKHHEIYLSDPRKCNRAKMKTVLRIPVK